MAKKQETQWWNPFDGDIIPGVNVRAGIRQLFTGKDEDVFEGFSTGKVSRPGQVHLGFIPDVGVTARSGGETSGVPSTPTGTPNKITNKVTNDFNVDPAVAAWQALQAENAAKASRIRNQILDKSGDIDKIYNDIIDNIETLLADRKRTRQEQFDIDSATLLDALTAAIPEIQKAFASLGLSSSTFVDRNVGKTEREHERSQEDVYRQFENDLTSYGQWADAEKSDAKNARNKLINRANFVEDLDANADNLVELQKAALTFDDSLSDFGSQRSRYTPSGKALSKLNEIGTDYDFGKTLEAFGNFAGSAANTGTGGNAAGRVLDSLRGIDDKKKKKLTEVEINNPVGAASA